jgi:zona occludens toxin
MPVLGFTGLPGHGKSYGVVANVIYPALKSGRTVVTNIPMNRKALRAKLKADGMPGMLKLLTINLQDFKPDKEGNQKRTFTDNVPDGAIVVLDELWRLWPSGLRADKVADDHKSFLAEHRHRVGKDGKTMEIVLVTQDLNQIAAFAKTLVERTYVVRKLKEVGLDNHYKVEIYAGKRIDGTGGQLIGSSRGQYSPEFWDLYKSHTKSDGVGIEVEADSRGTVWSSGMVKFAIPGAIAFLLVALYLGNVALQRLYAAGSDPEADVPPTQTRFSSQEVIPPTQTPLNPFPAKPSALPGEQRPLVESRYWRVVGVLSQDAEGVAILASTNGYAYIPLDQCTVLNERFLQYECPINGELAKPWTGQAGSTLAQVFGTD